MIVNDSPGEECRVAILQDHHLEELYTERTDTATNVGNIYKGRVTNVEPAIQAAFVDYGQGQSGFLHISDLHPRYFPGDAETERVGKKIPRRHRPPIQEALRRGQELLVQVMKEGIGTKGPTLTSYLSVPGRLLVMMPAMDRVGVSRKVEDEQKRREMRKVLDSLDLPDGFGFILRTAGFNATKTDLKRDAAYLLRLWKAMEKRINNQGAPCALYTESDLLIRTIRDVLRPTIETIVVDSDSAYERADAFMRVVAPRSAPKLIRYRQQSPIFHAFDIERQIDLIHSREVPLPSGGAIVIDQTEALVAIDVNSGKSRSASDAEQNAYRTNCEAVDEIARQLRLRDLGGLVVHDLIDMRAHRHRRQIEERFRENLKSDRARSTTLKISEFGIVEMTRQRMRPGIGKANFVTCSHCQGRGEVKAPEYLGAFAVRHTSYLLQFPQVDRVEIVCSPLVASFMLSHRRRQLVELEDGTGKRIDVRVSEAIAADRVDFYAYDPRNADVAVDKLPSVPISTVAQLARAER
jgi:ribonuclease E